MFILPNRKSLSDTKRKLGLNINEEDVSLKMKGRCSCVHRGGIIKEECRSLYRGETITPNAGEDCLTVTFFSSFLRLKDQRMSNLFFLFHNMLLPVSVWV